MSWLKVEEDVQVESQSQFEKITVSDAYSVEIIGARLQESQEQNSKSVSLILDVKNEDGEIATDRFTIMGKNGETYFIDKNGNKIQHFNLTMINTLFFILGTDIFKEEPQDIEYDGYDKDVKTFVKMQGKGFPSIIGKVIGVKIQMVREKTLKNVYEKTSIEGFFDNETGLSFEEVRTNKTKLDKWLERKKDFKEIDNTTTSSFGKKTAPVTDSEAPKKSKWGR